MIETNTHYNIGIGREWLPALKGLAKRLNFKKCPVASVIRALAMLAAAHPDKLESVFMFSSVEVQNRIKLTGTYVGSDPASN